MLEKKSLGLRSSKQQLREDFEEMYKQMTDPEEIDKKRRRREREERIKSNIEDYGL
jgi:hypothetical protein